MKKILSIFMLLVAFTTGAWAGDEWSINFASIGPNYADKTNVTISAKVASIGGTDMGTCTVASEALDSHFVLQTGTTWLMRKASGLYQGNGGGRAMGMLGCTEGQIITIVGTGNPNPSTNATLKSQNGNTYIYTVNADGDVKFTPARYLYFTSITVENPSASTVDYTVKYVDEGGTEIKSSTKGSGEAGASITLTSTEKASFLNKEGTKKYIYKSDDSNGKTIAGDGSTEVTITFREAVTWNYTLNSNLGVKISEGSAFEEDVVYVAYPRYILQGKSLYEAGVTDKEYRKAITMDEDNKVETVTYTESINNVIFYSEGEDLSGIAETTYGNIPVRASNAKAATTAEDVNITTLAAGKYRFYIGAFTSASKDFSNYNVKIGVGDEVFVATMSGANLNVITEEYIVEGNTQIKYLADGSSNNSALDYIVIEKIAEIATLPSSGIGTLASAYPLDLIGVEAYVISNIDGEGRAICASINEAPANTGIILVGEPNAKISIPIVDSAEAPASNLLEAAVEETPVGANEAYIVKDGKFCLVENASNVPAGKAYLPAIGISSAKALSLSFGEITGISEAEAAKATVAAEGKFIENGKLVIVKNGQKFNANGAQVK